MATPNTRPLQTGDRREREAWLSALADEVPDSGGLSTSTVAGFEVDDELSALVDTLATEGPVRGEPFK